MAKKSTGTGRTKREGAKLEARRAEVFRRWSAGESLRRIGAAMKMPASLVALDVQLALNNWRDQHRASISQAVEQEWQTLNWVHLEAQRSWELSQGQKGEDVGDPRFLDAVMKAGDHRRKLLGIDKPTKTESQTTVEVSLSSSFIPLDEMRARIRKRHEALIARAQDSQDDEAE